MKGFVNPLQMGLLGGIAAWGSQMDKFNMLNASLEASKERYKSRYDAMAQVQAERAKNNALLQANLKELGQRQQKNLMTDDQGNQYWSIGHKVHDQNDPSGWSYHEDARLTPEQYQKQFGPKSSTASPYKTVGGSLVDTSKLDANGNPTAVYTAPDKQGAIQDRQLTVQAAREKAIADRQKDAQQRADQAKKIDRVETLTGKDMANWDKVTDDATKRQLLKDAGVPLPGNTPSHLGGLIGDNPPSGDALESLRGEYEKAMQAKHAKNLGVTPQQLEAGAPADAVPPEDTGTGDTTIKAGADGKKYKIIGTDPVTGKVQAEPLAMDQVDLGDDDVAQAQPSGEEENDPWSGNDDGAQQQLLSQYAQQQDQGYQDQMNQLAQPDEEDQPGIMSGLT